MRRFHLFRPVVLTLCGVLALEAAATLWKGEPDFLSFFGQPVSAVLALAVAVLFAFVAFTLRTRGESGKRPWHRTGARPDILRRPDGAPGRNAPCPCGSGRKYKRCCLAAEEEAARRRRLAERSAFLNESHKTLSPTEIANRGLRGNPSRR